MIDMDIQKALSIKQQFPIFANRSKGKSLVYLDNAASTQKPLRVIERMRRFYENEYATIHRGVYSLSLEATQSCDSVRENVQHFIGAALPQEIIFTSGSTMSINMVAFGLASFLLQPGDEVLVSEVEHHANLVPWQIVCERTGARLRSIAVTDKGELMWDDFLAKLNSRTKIVAIAHASNVLGTIFPVKEIAKKVHDMGALVFVDGAQSMPHMKIDVRDLDCDFFCFSGHKIYGPTGIGILYGKSAYLEKLQPFVYGGDMIDKVTWEKTTFAPLPARLEAGTPAIASIIGLGEAIDFLREVGVNWIHTYESELLEYAYLELKKISHVRIIGEAPVKSALISFVMEAIHPHDIGTIVDQYGVAIRAGHHCSQTTMKRFGVPATARLSMGVYNTPEDIDVLVKALIDAIRIMKV